MIVYLIRHGQSQRQGPAAASDPQLSDMGRLQAELAGERLRDEGIEMLLSSPLLRALETAEIVGGKIGLKPLVWADLVEAWDGSEATPASILARRFPHLVIDIPERWWPAQEDEQTLYRRAARLSERLRSLGDETDRRIGAVGHGTFGAVLMSTFLGAPPCGYTRFSQHNCCISILHLGPGRAKLYRGNDVSHLPKHMFT